MEFIGERPEHVACDDDYACTYRIKVPGGWVIRSRSSYGSSSASIHQIFVKDPKHTWVIKDEQAGTT